MNAQTAADGAQPLPHSPRGDRGRPWAVTALTGLLVVVVWRACFYFPLVWTATGIGEADKPFLDLQNLLSAGEAAQHGIDPFVSNPYDPYHRLHGYTEWFLLTGKIGLTLKDTVWLGVVLLGLTLLSAVLLLRPTDWREGRMLALLLVSPPLLLAISRANHDLVVFVVMCVALACLRAKRWPLRTLAVLLLAIAAALKYFPLAAAVLLLEARTRRELLGWLSLYCFALLLAWPSLERGLQNAFLHQPAPSWLYAFGAPVVFRDFDLTVPIMWLRAVMLILAAAASWPALKAGPGAPSREDDREREFICGAVMVAGCFLHGSSYIYKMVFALWMLPWLWRTRLAGGEDRWRKAILALLLGVMWFEGGVAILLNLLVFASAIPLDVAHNLLKTDLVLSQILSYALVLCLIRSLVLYAAMHARRLIGPAPLSARILPAASDAQA